MDVRDMVGGISAVPKNGTQWNSMIENQWNMDRTGGCSLCMKSQIMLDNDEDRIRMDKICCVQQCMIPIDSFH